MKKIIKGKLYDTDTATKLCEYTYGNSSDHKYCHEALYKTKIGAYFLYGKGGAASQYAIQVSSNEYSGSKSIQAISIAAVLDWLEEHSELMPLDDALIQELQNHLELA
ncbi:MAG: hypothetical protein Q7T91_00550 [Sulfuricurvum sp.]|nr:hypothetical protein [Sulfuricurvum sp.]